MSVAFLANESKAKSSFIPLIHTDANLEQFC